MQSHRQKQLKKGEKKMIYTHAAHGQNTQDFFADFRDLYIFEKSLDLYNKLIYYSVRYSGIVQSVEQRTVNPYVVGSSPTARAKISAGFRGFLFFSNLKLFPFSVPKYRQYLYYFYTRMHF